MFYNNKKKKCKIKTYIQIKINKYSYDFMRKVITQNRPVRH